MNDLQSRLMDDIKNADYVIFGVGREIYDSTGVGFEKLHNFIETFEHLNYFVVSTDEDGAAYRAGFNAKRVVCPLAASTDEDSCGDNRVSAGAAINADGASCANWDFYNKWLSSSIGKKLVIIELGEGFAHPEVIRWPFERIVMINNKSKLYRINKTFYQIPAEISERAVPVHEDAVVFLSELAQ